MKRIWVCLIQNAERYGDSQENWRSGWEESSTKIEFGDQSTMKVERNAEYGGGAKNFMVEATEKNQSGKRSDENK